MDIVFFPIGLYGLWKGTLFSDKMKWIVTGAVATIVIVLGGGALLDFIYALVLCPFGIFLLWKDPTISKTTTYKFGGASALIIVAFLAVLPFQQTTSDTGGGCAAVTQSGNCTYYRDSTCKVIARDCD